MKTLKKTILVLGLFASTACFSQTKTTKVYNTVNGIREITPTKIIVEKQNKIFVYGTTNGIKNITSEQVIEKSGNQIRVYNTPNGIKEITPSIIIKK